MTSTHAAGRETVSFHRCSEVGGVELRRIANSERPWSRFSAEYEFFVPGSWSGLVWHRRRESTLGPGSVLCAQPGEVFSARRVLTPGFANALLVETPVLAGYTNEHGVALEELRLRSITRVTPELSRRLLTVFASLQNYQSSLEVQSSLVEFVSALLRELGEDTAQPLSQHSSEAHAASNIRDYLHADVSSSVDLDTLARHTGLSRFQVLRLFKRRYGLPPHTYQLQRRLVLAQKRLREGARPAKVAVEYGFVDQSHLTRHFKRLIGVTPAQYAKASGL
ncbi:MAG: AraC family transcriptional regulator [Polyangiaceae bacterium]